MREIILYYARCNRTVNNSMAGLIASASAQPMDMALDGYFFPTLGALLDHMYVSDCIWMSTFLGMTDYGLRIGDAVDRVPGYGERVFSDFAAWRQARSRLDDLIVAFAEAFRDEDAAKITSRVTKSGERIERLLWKALIHFFNHQTHHRGQVSAILDGLGIENNFSNMIYLD